jgi:deoxyuridine 5'-triphosphate nucleotidohydrolase
MNFNSAYLSGYYFNFDKLPTELGSKHLEQYLEYASNLRDRIKSGEEIEWSDNCIVDFCRGIIEGTDMVVRKTLGQWILKIENAGKISKHFDQLGINFRVDNESDLLFFEGPNVLDLLDKLYRDARICSDVESPADFRFPNDIINDISGISDSDIPHAKVFLANENAVMPSKEKATDVGFDLTIISVDKVSPTGVVRYDTGVVVQPDFGWYFIIVPRSSFSELGYVMPNCVGIIDKGYTGTLKIPLLKVSSNAPEIKLPYKGFQIIMMPTTQIILDQVDESKIIKTKRDNQGFGSTNFPRKRPAEECSNDDSKRICKNNNKE